MYKRTFSISHILLDNLRQISSFCGINIATISRMAVYHGIERIKNGYVPVRDNHKKTKQKFEIILPEETWAEFSEAMESIKYQLEEHTPDGEMVEMFLKIELQKFMNLYVEYEKEAEKEAEKGKYYNDKDKAEISTNTEIPRILYDKLERKQKKLGIKQTQLVKYLLLCGSIQEYFLSEIHTIDTDADLLNEISILGLDKVKTITLIRYLIANNRIVWKSRD